MGTYVVTGGAGFIGSHLVERLLNSGHLVRVVDDLSSGKLSNLDKRTEFIEGNILNEKLLSIAAKGVDGIFHLAAIASVEKSNIEWINTHKVNLSGTVSVLDTARSLGGIPVIYASSAAIYGSQTRSPLKETMCAAPQTAYGADKYGSELHAAVAQTVHGVPTIGLRFFNVYGPKQDPLSPYSGVISIFVDKILKGENVIIHGDGGQTRDFIFVSDVVQHLVLAMKLAEKRFMEKHSVLNVCSGSSTSILNLAMILEKIISKKINIIYQNSRPGDIRCSVGDNTLAKCMLGVRSSVSLVDGLKRYLSTY